jgi:hypothetical protein
VNRRADLGINMRRLNGDFGVIGEGTMIGGRRDRKSLGNLNFPNAINTEIGLCRTHSSSGGFAPRSQPRNDAAKARASPNCVLFGEQCSSGGSGHAEVILKK